MNLRAPYALAAAVLVVLSGTASAETICDRCAYTFPGTYLGALWTGDRSTLTGANSSPVAPIDHHFVIDVNENGALTLSASGFAGVKVQVHYDQGSLCAAQQCSQVVIGPVISVKARKVQTRLVAGRYVLHIDGPAGGAYSGLVELRRVK